MMNEGGPGFWLYLRLGIDFKIDCKANWNVSSKPTKNPISFNPEASQFSPQLIVQLPFYDRNKASPCNGNVLQREKKKEEVKES
jgi:hypothetical protein